MRVRLTNRYWEYTTYANDVVKVIDKAYGFELVKEGGFKKEFGAEWDYFILREGEYF